MKKFTILLGAILLFSVSYAQIAQVQNTSKSCNTQDNRIMAFSQTRDANIILTEDFDGNFPPADWTIIDGTQSQGTQHWHQFDAGGSFGNVARILYDDNGDQTPRPQDEWLISPEVTLPANNPIVRFFFQTVKDWLVTPNNNADINVKISTDGGSSWTQLWNEHNYAALKNHEWAEVTLDLQAYAGQSVKIAFQYVGTNAARCSIDKVTIFERPAEDLALASARVNFYPAYNNYGYSGFYAKLPKRIAENENAFIYFSADIKNRGIESAIPTLKGTLTDPSGNVIIEKTQTFGDTLTLTTDQNDTVRMWQDENIFTIPEPVLGAYTWDIEVSKEGVTDEITEDNKLTYTTEITENYYSHNTGTVSGKYSTHLYPDATDNDATGVTYWFIANDTIEKMNIFVHKDTEIGASFKCQLYKTNDDGQTWNEFATSNEINITDASQLDRMHEVPFIELAPIDVPSGQKVEIMAAVKYSGGKFFLGLDKTVPSSGFETYMYSVNKQKWYYSGERNKVPIIDLVLHEPGSDNAIEEINADNINVYPNPTNGVFNIENVRGADVEVFNLIGQRVFSAVEVEENISVNLSNLSEGTYVVRISGTNSVKTQKINLVR